MTNNVIEILKKDHQKLLSTIEKLTAAIESEKADVYPDLFQKFKQLFKQHDEAEDNIFYPELKKFPNLKQLILKGYQAHHMVEVGILELRITPYNSESWGPKFLVIKDSIQAHLMEEEEEIFPSAEEQLNEEKLQQLGGEVTKSRH